MTKMNLIVIGLVLVLTAAFVFALLIPGMRELESQRAQIGEAMDEVRQQQDKVGNVSHLYASIMKLDEQMRNYRNQLPTQRKFGEFLKDLAQSLKQGGVEDYVVQPRPALHVDEAKLPETMKLARGTTILPVSISFEGSFTKLFEFLKSVEELPRLSHVESMKLVGKESKTGDVRVEIMLHAYHRPDPSVRG